MHSSETCEIENKKVFEIILLLKDDRDGLLHPRFAMLAQGRYGGLEIDHAGIHIPWQFRVQITERFGVKPPLLLEKASIHKDQGWVLDGCPVTFYSFLLGHLAPPSQSGFF